jgi:hypothetical protein
MTIDEITSEVRRHTYGLLNDGEVVYAVQMCLTAHGGIDPADVQKVEVVFEKNNLDIRFAVAPPVEYIDLSVK